MFHDLHPHWNPTTVTSAFLSQPSKNFIQKFAKPFTDRDSETLDLDPQSDHHQNPSGWPCVRTHSQYAEMCSKVPALENVSSCPALKCCYFTEHALQGRKLRKNRIMGHVLIHTFHEPSDSANYNQISHQPLEWSCRNTVLTTNENYDL